MAAKPVFLWLHAAALIALIAPVWAFPIFPTQDGAAHVYDAKLLREYSDPANTAVRSTYRADFTHRTNWTIQRAMAFLQGAVSPAVSEKIILSLCLFFFPAGVAFLSRRVHGGFHPAEILGYALGYNHMLFMGFYNFVLATGLVFFVLGWWWPKRRDSWSWSWRWLIFFGAFCGLVLATHIASLLILITAIGTYQTLLLFKKLPVPNSPKGIWRLTASILPIVICGFFGLLILDHFRSEPPSLIVHYGSLRLFNYLANGRFLDALRSMDSVSYGIILAWFTAHVIYAVVSGFEGGKRFWGLAAVMCLALYTVSPSGFTTHSRHMGAILNERWALFILPFLAVSFALPRRGWKILSACALAFLTVLHTGQTVAQVRALQPEFKTFLSGTRFITPHSTYRFLTSNDVYTSEAFGRPDTVEVWEKSAFRYGWEQPDVAFAGMLGHRINPGWPHHFEVVGDGKAPSDFIVAWKSSAEALAGISKDYEEIFAEGRLRILSKKSSL